MKIAFAALVLGFCLTSLTRADQIPGTREPLSRPLAVGEIWTHPDRGLRVTFERVVKDTRRPRSRDAVSESQGHAVVELTLLAGNQAARRFFVSTKPGSKPAVTPAWEYEDGVSGIPKSYVVSIGRLLPSYSRQGGIRSQRAYRLRLAVAVAL